MESSYPDDNDDDSSDNNSLHESSNSSLSDISIENIYDDQADVLFAPLIQYLVTGNRKQRVEDYLSIVKSWGDVEFIEHFRLSRRTAYQLIGELKRSNFIPVNNFGMKPISAEISF
ncbi:hypothetical protein PV325_004496 [Microctonus aethiopoides]|nr:hypothetical protein PV325_004496 [Microctonus aethiopoides]